jgi:hypothetical protein
MLKRETLFTTLPSEDTARIRELVSFRARISTIAVLVPHQYAQTAARQMYAVSDARAPGGTQSPCKQVLVIYRRLTARITLTALYNEFMDLRSLDVRFEDSVVCVYRKYRQRIGWFVDEDSLITFDHFFVVARELETRESKLIPCSCCGSRNLRTKHTSIVAFECVFCVLLEGANAKSTKSEVINAVKEKRTAFS